MQVNKFMTMVVGLVVGVMLIAGVVTPVIANVSSDGGGTAKSHTNTGGSDRYSLADENTNFSVYPVADYVISLQPDTVEDRVTYEINSDYTIWFTELGNRDQFSIREHIIGDSGSMMFMGAYTMLSITGTTLTAHLYDGTTRVLEGEVLYYMDPLGSYIDNIKWTYNEETGYYGSAMGTAYVFKDTPIYANIDIYTDDENVDWVGSYYVYGSSTKHYIYADLSSDYLDYDCEGTAIFTFTGDILSSIGLTIGGVLYTVPIPAPGQPVEPVATINGMEIDLFLFIVPIDVVEGEGKVVDINAEPPYYGEKMGMEMAHFTESIPEITLSFEKGVDEQGNPCFVHPSAGAGLPNVYAHPGEILYASQYCVAFVGDNLNGSDVGVQISYLSRNYDGTGGYTLIPNVVIATNMVEIEARYGSIYPIADGTSLDPAPATDSDFGVFIPMYADGISEWYGFIERGIYTIKDGSARVDSLPIVGGAYNASGTALPSFFNGYTYNGSAVTFEYDLSDGVVSNLHGQESGSTNEAFNKGYSVLGYDLVIPEDDEGESGGDSDDGNSGNGLSSTIKTTLSVIPLVMTVGLVLGAVAFFRMKN